MRGWVSGFLPSHLAVHLAPRTPRTSTRSCFSAWPGVLLLLLAGCRDGVPGQFGMGGEGAEASPVDAVLAAAPRGANVHIVRVIARGGRYTFEPSEVHIRSGDVVRFVHTDNQPQAVTFDLERLPSEAAQRLREQGADAGPLLTEPGAVFEIHFRDLPEGSYPFFSVSHAERGMRGEVIVSPDGAAPPSP